MSNKPFREILIFDYQAIYGGDPLKREEQFEKWQKSLDASNMSQQRSKMNSIIKQELDERHCTRFTRWPVIGNMVAADMG